MAYCGPRAVPHWHFLGGPARWTQHDREAALWWLMHERQRCSSCGTRPAEWDLQQGGHPHAYRAKLTGCPGCARLENARKAHDRKADAPLSPGESWSLVRNLEVVGVDAASSG